MVGRQKAAAGLSVSPPRSDWAPAVGCHAARRAVRATYRQQDSAVCTAASCQHVEIQDSVSLQRVFGCSNNQVAGRWSSRCYCAVQACHGRYPPVDHTKGAIGIIHKDRKSPRLRSRPRRSSSARMFIQMRTQAAAHLLTMHMSMQTIEMHCARSIMHVIAILWPNRCLMTHTVWSPRNSQRGMTHAASAALCAHRRNVQPNIMN
jgi:hypothetical protein